MNKIIKYILFFLVFFINTGLYAQSVIKHVSGDVYQVIGSIQKPIKDLNTIVNDSNLLIFAPSSYIIVEIDGKKSMINAEDHENGIRLINFNNHTNNHTNKESSSFWAEIFDAVYDDSFDKKIDIDGLKIVGSQGITRSISNNLLELRVLPNYRSKIEYVEGKNLTINTTSHASEDGELLKLKLIANKDNINGTSSVFIDKHDFSNCSPCYVMLDNEKRGVIKTSLISNEDNMFLESLFLNIENEIDVEISQFCIIRLFIVNELFINANYYIDEFSDNKLLEDYFKNIQFY